MDERAHDVLVRRACDAPRALRDAREIPFAPARDSRVRHGRSRLVCRRGLERELFRVSDVYRVPEGLGKSRGVGGRHAGDAFRRRGSATIRESASRDGSASVVRGIHRDKLARVPGDERQMLVLHVPHARAPGARTLRRGAVPGVAA